MSIQTKNALSGDLMAGVPSDTVEAMMHRPTWDAAFERFRKKTYNIYGQKVRGGVFQRERTFTRGTLSYGRTPSHVVKE